MHCYARQCGRLFVSSVLTVLFIATPTLLAQSHVVSQDDIHKELVTATQTRQKNLEKVKQFLSSDAAEKAMKSAQVDPAQVKAAVSTLSDAEVAQLASRADRAQQDFAAGRISDRDLILIILGIAVLILIIVAVN